MSEWGRGKGQYTLENDKHQCKIAVWDISFISHTDYTFLSNKSAERKCRLVQKIFYVPEESECALPKSMEMPGKQGKGTSVLMHHESELER